MCAAASRVKRSKRSKKKSQKNPGHRKRKRPSNRADKIQESFQEIDHDSSQPGKRAGSSAYNESSVNKSCSFTANRRQGRVTFEEGSERWTARVAMKALAGVVRTRKDIVHLHVKTMGDHLAFIYLVEKPGDGHSTPTTYVKVMHKVGFSPANGVAAVASTEGASELVAQPSVLSSMLEPLKRSSEIALLINDRDRVISGVTFQHGDLPENMASNMSRMKSKLKTETNVAYDELIDVHYVGHSDDVSGSMSKGIPPPENMKDHMVLVITHKEFKAFLQYCQHAILDQELRLTVNFFWGGKPMVIKTMGEHFDCELIMATLDHQLLRNALHLSLSASATNEAVAAATGTSEETNEGWINQQ
jgi:hypothetical protein